MPRQAGSCRLSQTLGANKPMQHQRKILLAVAASAFTLFTAAAYGSTDQSAAMRDCVEKAGDRKGEVRKQFMTQCLTEKGKSIKVEAKNSPVEDPCESGSAFGSIQCMKPSWDRSERELNRAYIAARSKLRAAKIDGLEEKLLQAQRVWIEFREKHCRFNAAMQVEGNTWNSFWFMSCMAAEADLRTAYLKDLEP